MEPTRNVRNLSALHLLGIADGLRETAARADLGPDEKRRLKRAFATARVLKAEAHGRVLDPAARAQIADLDARVDRAWFALRDSLDSLARLGDELPVAAEAERLSRTYFRSMDFTRLDAPAQAEHGRALLAHLGAEELSEELRGWVGAIVSVLHEVHPEYERAVQAERVTVRQASLLGAARRDAADALQAFVALVEVLAESPEDEARARALLAPVDATLAKARVTPRAGGEAGPDAAREGAGPRTP